MKKAADLTKKNNKDFQRELNKLHQVEAVIDRSPVIFAIFHFVENWPLSYISANVNLWGYTQEDFLSGRITWRQIAHPEDVVRIEAEIVQHLKSKKWTFIQNYRVIHKSGAVRWMEDHSSFVFDKFGKISHMQSAIFDVTERKEAEAKLKESEERMRELLQKSFDIIVVVDQNGFFSYISPAVKNILGYSEVDLIGKNCFEFVHPEEKENAAAALKYIVKTKKSGIIIEFRFRHSSGSWNNMEILAANCLENPAVGGIVISARDVTDRRRLERRLSHSHKMEAIGTLAGGIAHEFNNLLMGIQGYVSLMLINKDSDDPDSAKLNGIQDLIHSGADLTGKLLGFAQGGQYEIKITDINDLVARTVSMFGRTKKEIAVHQKYAKNLWAAKIDRSQIEQVLMDIYVNAWQAMPGDGGDIYIETDNVQIADAKAEALKIKAGDYVRITITDTGSGMDEKTCSRVFEPFFTTKEKSHGVGLSMASAYGIIRNHEGAIEVASELGQGTIFSIYLPASTQAVPKEAKASKAVARGTETVLLVDDEESVLYVCKEILSTIGYNVLAAENGRDALNIYKEHKDAVDLVILDMIMPGLSGGETYDELKLINPQVKVMLSTGFSVSEQARKIMEKGCQAIIQKPFRLEDLSQKVREVIGQK